MHLIPKATLVAAFMTTTLWPVAGAVMDAPRTGQIAVAFAPGTPHSQMLDAVAQADARLVRFAKLPGTAVLDVTAERSIAVLRAHGVWVVADPIVLGGCSAPRA